MMRKLIFTLYFIVASLVCTAQRTYIGYLFPTGGMAGSEFVVEIGGQNIEGASAVMISGEGVTAEVLPPQEMGKKSKDDRRKKINKNMITDEDNLQLAQTLHVKITIAKDAQLGIRDFKVVSKKGIVSNRLFFEVSQYPNFVEREPNGTFSEANKAITTPMVVCGQVEKGGRDFISFEAKEGDDLVLETKARRFVPYLADAVPGWFQAVLTLYDESGVEVAYCDDYKLIADPVIIYKVPKSGQYTLQIRDAIFRGREDFVYRIAVGTIPFVRSVFPLGGRKGLPLKLTLDGVNLNKESVNIKIATDAEDRVSYNVSNKKKEVSNSFTLAASNKKEIVIDRDLGDNSSSALPVLKNQVINAKIDHYNDQDWYIVNASAKQTLVFDIMARRLNSELDALLAIYDENGKEIAREDDTLDQDEGMITHHADPQLSHRFEKGGRYFIKICDTQSKFGNDYGYRFQLFSAQPDFELRVEPSTISIPQGGTAQLSVFAIPKYNFKGKIEVTARNLPEGFVISEGEIKNSKMPLKLTITAPVDCKMERIDFEIVGKCTLKGKTIEKVASPVEAMMQAFYITHLIPIDEFRVDITEPLPFSVELLNDGEPVVLKEKGMRSLKVRLNRAEGYKRDIQLSVRPLQKGTICTPIVLKSGETEGELLFEAESWKKENMTTRAIIVATEIAEPVDKSAPKVKGVKKVVEPLINTISPLFEIVTPSAKWNDGK